MSNINIDIIISRYNEDLSWTMESPFNLFQYIVYNKGNNENFNKTNVKQTINIENVGKNDHTYLYHITNNYDNLSNIIVFFPGSLNLDYKKNKAKIILRTSRANRIKNTLNRAKRKIFTA